MPTQQRQQLKSLSMGRDITPKPQLLPLGYGHPQSKSKGNVRHQWEKVREAVLKWGLAQRKLSAWKGQTLGHQSQVPEALMHPGPLQNHYKDPHTSQRCRHS